MNEIRSLYDSIHMPSDLEERIRKSAPTPKRRFRPVIAVAAALIMVCLLGCSPTVREAVEEWMITSFSGLDLTIYEKEMEGGGTGQIVVIDTEANTFAHVENGRLYFTGNGENLDITDQITPENPFYYTYEDQDYEITLIVGFDGSQENFGVYEFIKENGAWVTGFGRNIFSQTEEGELYPWVGVIWDTLDIPWPMPGAP